MRTSCKQCAIKHLSQALVLMHEAVLGYPMHKWLAIGHLAEASDELVTDYPEMANTVRTWRKMYESGETQEIPILDIIEELLR